jgi:hypothetical protein
LISNLGFGDDATHTKNDADKSSKLTLESLVFPLSHPEYIVANREADKIAFIAHYTNLRSRLKTHMKALLPARVRDILFNRSIERFIKSYRPLAPIVKDYDHNHMQRARLERYSTHKVR